MGAQARQLVQPTKWKNEFVKASSPADLTPGTRIWAILPNEERTGPAKTRPALILGSTFAEVAGQPTLIARVAYTTGTAAPSRFADNNKHRFEFIAGCGRANWVKAHRIFDIPFRFRHFPNGNLVIDHVGSALMDQVKAYIAKNPDICQPVSLLPGQKPVEMTL
ncbi:MAG: hypothetical protein GC136_08705 [Alphaproteobacteria bacterium]|nr:hypothetical protein [Alphaproteobacteria bacterium]